MGISQTSFVAKHEPTWQRFEALLDDLEDRYQALPADTFPTLYREVCLHLSIARHRGYSAAISDRLNTLVERGHAQLYGSRVGRWSRIIDYAAGGFARQVRAEWRLLWLSLALFVIPAVGIFLWLQFEPTWAIHILGPATLHEFETMYTDSASLRIERDSESDLLMFAYYIENNVGIALRTFGSGALFGLGSLFILAFNGVYMGAIAGHLNNVGLSGNLWPFAITHGAFELTAIVFAGMTGFKVGLAPVWPGRRRRLDALRHAAHQSVGLVAGFSLMLLIAAFIEAFWSASSASDTVKYVVGALMWALVIGYFTFAGRGVSEKFGKRPPADGGEERRDGSR